MIKRIKDSMLSTKGSFTPQSICGGLLFFVLLYIINLNHNIANWINKSMHENPVKGAVLLVSILAACMIICNLLFLLFKDNKTSIKKTKKGKSK